MAGLSLRTGLGFRASAADQTSDPSMGTVNYAAFQPGSTTAMQSRGASLSPGHAFGLAFWVGAGALGLLVLFRQSLPR